MFRLAIVVLAIVGLVSLLSGEVSGAATGVGILFLLPLLLLGKVLFFVVLLGFIGRGFARRGPARDQSPWGRRERAAGKSDDRPSPEERFEEWHRMAHAREEVDSWIEDVD